MPLYIIQVAVKTSYNVSRYEKIAINEVQY